MIKTKHRYVYGPVPSRRLGRSLGVDLVPFKVCNYDCIYCQLGRITNKTIERREYISPKAILQDLRDCLKLGDKPDYITVSGSGEATLNSSLEEIISKIKEMTDIPLAVLTNGSLLYLPEVRKACCMADLVLPSLDAGEESMFKHVNRPCKEIEFNKMIEGLVKFREEYSGKIWLEVFLLGGVNSLKPDIIKIKNHIAKIKPDKIQVNTVARPPAEDYAYRIDLPQLIESCKLFGENAEVIADFLETKHVDKHILTNTRLDKILGDDKVKQVELSDGRILDADMVLIGIGVQPNISLAEFAGIETCKDGIVVDAHMQTSDKNIFACGDCTIKKSFFTGKPTNLKLASIATMESRVAGANLFEIKRKQEGVIGVFSTIVDNTVFAVAGLGEKQACELDYKVVTGEVEASNRHPGKMPGATNIKLKLVFNKSNGELLGGTARGSDSVGEMINTISACIQKKMTANDIAQFQLGTHPAVTASPIAYQLVNAAELAIKKIS